MMIFSKLYYRMSSALKFTLGAMNYCSLVTYVWTNREVYEMLHKKGHRVRPSLTLAGYARQVAAPVEVMRSACDNPSNPTIIFKVEPDKYQVNIQTSLKRPDWMLAFTSRL